MAKNNLVQNVNSPQDFFDLGLEKYNRRELDLGIDPAVDKIRVNEIQTALNLENHKGITLQRGSKGQGDWIDPKTGKSYDDVASSTPSEFFDEQWNRKNIQDQIDDHVADYDHPVIDFTQSDLTPNQKEKVTQYIRDQGYSNVIFIN